MSQRIMGQISNAPPTRRGCRRHRSARAAYGLRVTVHARGYARARHHPCVNGTPRVAHAAMETCLLLNGMILHASVDEQEQLMLALAAGRLT